MKGRRGYGEKRERERGKKQRKELPWDEVIGVILRVKEREGERERERGGGGGDREREREKERREREKATLFLQNNALTSQKDAARNATICTSGVSSIS